MDLREVVLECAKNAEFVSNFDRLRGTNLSRKGSPIEIAIDDATGRMDADSELFFDFVFMYVWMPLVAESLVDP